MLSYPFRATTLPPPWRAVPGGSVTSATRIAHSSARLEAARHRSAVPVLGQRAARGGTSKRPGPRGWSNTVAWWPWAYQNNIDINATRQEAANILYVDINQFRGDPKGETHMLGTKACAVAVKNIALVFMLGAALHAIAQDTQTPYPNMAPLEQY